MKKLFTKAPLFVSICISMAAMFVLTQFIEPLQTYFPVFSDDVTQIKDSVVELANLIDATVINPRREENTLYVATPLDLNETIVPDTLQQSDDSSSIVLTEEPVEEAEPAFVPLETDGPLVPTPRASERGAKTLSAVDESYFDDAVFIGDSRTVGLYMYSPFENADYLCDVGMNIYDCMDRDIEFKGNSHTTVRDILSTHRYSKVYIMLGINEIGSSAQKYCEKYEEVLETIHSYQPDAIIIIQGIMCVGKQKSDTHPHFNNPNIRARNDMLKELANNEYIYYLEVNDGICDEDGNLPADYSFDQIHLYAQYYYLWKDYLLAHAFK